MTGRLRKAGGFLWWAGVCLVGALLYAVLCVHPATKMELRLYCAAYAAAAVAFSLLTPWTTWGVLAPSQLLAARVVSPVTACVVALIVYETRLPKEIPFPPDNESKPEVYAAADGILIAVSREYAGTWLKAPLKINLESLRAALQGLRLPACSVKGVEPTFASGCWTGETGRVESATDYYGQLKERLKRAGGELGYVSVADVRQALGAQVVEGMASGLPRWSGRDLQLDVRDVISAWRQEDKARLDQLEGAFVATLWRASNRIDSWKPKPAAAASPVLYLKQFHSLTEQMAKDLTELASSEQSRPATMEDAAAVVREAVRGFRARNAAPERALSYEAVQKCEIEKVPREWWLRLPCLKDAAFDAAALQEDIKRASAQRRLAEANEALRPLDDPKLVFLNVKRAEEMLKASAPVSLMSVDSVPRKSVFEALGLADEASVSRWLQDLGATLDGDVYRFEKLSLWDVVQRYGRYADKGLRAVSKLHFSLQVKEALGTFCDRGASAEGWQTVLERLANAGADTGPYRSVDRLLAGSEEPFNALLNLRQDLARLDGGFFKQIEETLDDRVVEGLLAWKRKQVGADVDKAVGCALDALPALVNEFSDQPTYKEIMKPSSDLVKRLEALKDSDELRAIWDMQKKAYRLAVASEVARKLIIESAVWQEGEIKSATLGYDFAAVAPKATALLVQRALLCSHPDLAGRVDQVLAAKVEEGKAGCLQAATIEWPTDAVVESVRKETASVLGGHARIWSLYQRLRPVCAGLQGARFQFIWSHLVQGKDVQGKPGGPKLKDLNQATQGVLGLTLERELTLKRELGKSIVAVFGRYTDNEPSPKIPPENRGLRPEEWEESRKAFDDYNLRLAAEKPPVPGYQSRRFRDSAGKGLEYRKVQMVLGDPPVGWREFAEALGQVTEPWAAPAQ